MSKLYSVVGISSGRGLGKTAAEFQYLMVFTVSFLEDTKRTANAKVLMQQRC